MKKIYIQQLNTGDVIVDFFMLKTMEVKKGSNQKYYLAMTLSDKTGEIDAKKWDLADEEMAITEKIHPGDLLKIKAKVTEWNQMRQLTVTRVRQSNKEDQLSLRDFIKVAPEEPEDMYQFILDRVEQFQDKELALLCTQVLEEHREKLLYYPAATRNHHAEMGGLLWHIKRMIQSGERLAEVYPIIDRDLLLTGVILHDMEKINEIVSNSWGIADQYSFEGELLGHLVLGVRELEKQMEKLGLSREKATMIQHMVLSHHYEPDFGSPKKPLFPEAELLHYLDILDARMYDMEEVLNKTDPGEFSERHWVLENRKLYRRKEPHRD